MADNNFIDIEVRENNDYFGPIYIGSEFSENHLIYDTMSDWTIIVSNEAEEAEQPANYDPTTSNTTLEVF